MRLSIAIVFLIGAVVFTEVMGDSDMDQEVLNVLRLLEKTVTRIESGQTVTQNNDFIYLALDSTDNLLKLLSYQTLVNRGRISSDTPAWDVDGFIVPRIQIIQSNVPSDERTIHVKSVLQAIYHVLRGDLLPAAVTIEQSKNTLLNSVSSSSSSSSSSSRELGSNYRIPNYQVVSRSTFATTSAGGESRLNRSTFISEYTVTQIGIIRDWLYSMLAGWVTRNNEWISKMTTCVPEIAHALISSLPNTFLPSVLLKFIGRYPVEKPEAIRHRIETIVRHIRVPEMSEENDTRLVVQGATVLVLKDVLKAISHILIQQWEDAEKVMLDSIVENFLHQRTDAGELIYASIDHMLYMRTSSHLPFTSYMTVTYDLQIGIN